MRKGIDLQKMKRESGLKDFVLFRQPRLSAVPLGRITGSRCVKWVVGMKRTVVERMKIRSVAKEVILPKPIDIGYLESQTEVQKENTTCCSASLQTIKKLQGEKTAFSTNNYEVKWFMLFYKAARTRSRNNEVQIFHRSFTEMEKLVSYKEQEHFDAKQ
ncbi:hypothetical protein RJ641_021731 [Dillenia turbinata]|uniref:Uncharacterized protein n=1 Tax=Dillenia turbinata TaxID=194707 RepID=A0AAN8UFD0_9MAGN